MHLNVNSVRHKYVPLADVLARSMIDILSLQETKLDDSFPYSQIFVSGSKLHRKDHLTNSGGLMMLVRDDIAQRRRQDLDLFSVTSGRIELMVLEIRINAEKWLLVNMYKQPKVIKIIV